MVTSLTPTRMPAKLNLVPDWVETQANVKVAPKQGVASGFTYMFPVQKYVEAYTSQTGPGMGGYITYLSYNHGNQPYNPIDSGINTAFRTPALPNWYALSKISPKTSAPGTQLAQMQIAQQLQYRKPIGTTVNTIGL